MDRRRGGRAYGGGGGGGGGGASAASGAAASGLAGSPGGSTGLADSVARVSTTGGTGVGPASSDLSPGCDGLAASAAASAFTSVAVASMVGGSRPLRGVFPSLAIASFSRAHQRHNADPRRRQSGMIYPREPAGSPYQLQQRRFVGTRRNPEVARPGRRQRLAYTDRQAELRQCQRESEVRRIQCGDEGGSAAGGKMQHAINRTRGERGSDRAGQNRF